MCYTCSKIGKMKKRKHRVGMLDGKSAMSGLLDGVLGGVGAIGAQEVGAMIMPMIPATTLSADTAGEVVDVLKIAAGCLLPAMVGGEYHEHAKALGIGFAAQGSLNLFNKLTANPTYVRVGGADNRSYALAGADNRSYALAGGYRRPGSGPVTRSTFQTTGL